MAMGELGTEYAGRRVALFKLSLITSLLTVLTLGIYRFWMKTRLRRYYWSSIRVGNHPLEYVGQPLEKLLGFLIAVAFLSFYIGIVNLILMFLSFSFLGSDFWAYGVSFIGVLPILFYARFRARRYVLARTRWRGIRFGLEAGAWGYSWRALVHWAITIFSLGLLWPRMTFWLEKYRTDRTRFGDQHFVQSGTWTMLYRPFLPMLIGVVLVVAGSGFLWLETQDAGLFAIIPGLVIAAYGFGHYRVHSFRILMNHKKVGPIGFESKPRSRRIVWVYVFGYFLASLALLALLAVFGLAFFIALGGESFEFSTKINPIDVISGAPVWATIGLSVTIYFSLFIFWGVLGHVLVTLPVARHYAETLTITDTTRIGDVRQSDKDEMTQAEGFAEALDVGAAI